MINKDLRKSLARKNGNDILIWSWNNTGEADAVVIIECGPVTSALLWGGL